MRRARHKEQIAGSDSTSLAFSQSHRQYVLSSLRCTREGEAADSVNHVNVLFSRCTFISVQLRATLSPAGSITLGNALQKRKRKREITPSGSSCHTPLHHHQPITRRHSWGFVWLRPAWRRRSRCVRAKTMTPRKIARSAWLRAAVSHRYSPA